MAEKITLSKNNQKTLMVAANQEVETYAEKGAKAIFSMKLNLSYPPNGGLLPEESEALTELQKIHTPELESALRKVIADSSASAFFHFFNILDGTGDPAIEIGKWTRATILDLPEAIDYDPYDSMLHDAFFEAYWDWKKSRPSKDWYLDV